MTEAVFAEALETWLGPYESDFGWHVIRVVERSEARDPAFGEIEASVREVYAARQLEAANEAAFEEMRGYFDIAVQWAEGEEAQTWP